MLLLLACGNDDSCGDYQGVNANLLGSWAGDEIECSESSPHQGIRKIRYIFLSENDNEEDNYHKTTGKEAPNLRLVRGIANL